MSLTSLDDLFHDTLRDVFYAEKKLVKTLPKLARKVSNQELSQALTNHLAETEKQVSRLERVFETIGKPARGKTCEAMDGLVEEGSGVIEDAEDKAVLDVGILAAAQAVEHYEIARYGALIAWAKVLGLTEAVELLVETLEEEEAADKLLNEISERINPLAKGGLAVAAE
jgi:ferritin-like metal-binding protein YciE